MRKMMRRPTHPGNILKEDYLLPLSITIKDMAIKLGVSRKTIIKLPLIPISEPIMVIEFGAMDSGIRSPIF